jgi:hypothetical protein
MNTEFYDVRGPVDLPLGWWPFLLLFLVFFVGVAFFFSRRRRSVAQVFTAPLGGKTCWQAALESLDQLEAGHWNATDEMKQFYSYLSEVVRFYIELRFDLPAPERTTEEFLEYVSREDSFPQEDRNLLRDLLTLSDLVKFARYGTSTEEMSRALALARKYIERTIPVNSSGSFPPAGEGDA